MHAPVSCMSLTPLNRLLASAAQRAGITRDLAITHALQACQRDLEKLFGSAYSKFAEPAAVRSNGTLVVVCRSPAVAQTVRLHVHTIIANVQAAAPRAHVQHLLLIPRSRSDLMHGDNSYV